MNELELQRFIRDNEDWETILSEKPYSISIRHDTVNGRRLILFKYNLVEEPDFSIPLVKECRGLILDGDTFEVVSYPFNKFFNHGETYADVIDWSTAKVSTKIDGSIVKIVKDGNDLLISTNGCIDAYKAEISNQIECPFHSYGEIIESVLIRKFGDMESFKDILEEGYTYIFEMVSPFTKVVIPYSESDLYLIGCRDNSSFDEIFFKNCRLSKYFKTPELHPLRSIDDCLGMCEKMPWNEEGYVVMDSMFHRIKVKSFAYLSVHHLFAANGIMSNSRILDILRTNEKDEVLTYFPEHRRSFELIENRLNDKISEYEDIWKEFSSIRESLCSRKDIALWFKVKSKNTGILFSMLDGRIVDFRSGIMGMSNDSILKLIEI